MIPAWIKYADVHSAPARKEPRHLRCTSDPFGVTSSTGIIYITLLESSSATLVKHPGSHKIPSTKHSVVRKLKFIIQVGSKSESAENYCRRKTGLGKRGLYCAGAELWGTVQEAKKCGTVNPKCHPESAEGWNPLHMFTKVLLRNLFSTLKFPNNLELPNLMNTQVEDYATRIEGHPTSKWEHIHRDLTHFNSQILNL